MSRHGWRAVPADSNPFTRTAMTTLTTKEGTEWMCLKHNGRLAFGHGPFAITFEEGFFRLKKQGEILFVGMNAVECLEVAPECMLESYARHFKPSWE